MDSDFCTALPSLRPPLPPDQARSLERITYSPTDTRESSPSPSLSPTPGLFACPPLSRSFSSNASSERSWSGASTISQSSITPRSCSASAAIRQQRGYVRTQGVAFAPSAGHRDSVLSLGSIAHLQYYFARTGLLDGKGAQLAKDDRGKPGVGKFCVEPRIHNGSDTASDADLSTDTIFEHGEDGTEEAIMLPPTVSTYSHRTPYLPPPPDAKSLRQDLIKALEDATKALHQISQQQNDTASGEGGMGGWHEIQGLHLLDVITLAIRAAKLYYTSHDNSARLYSIRSERQLREDLLVVMDALKRMAGRNFAGGLKDDELRSISAWVNGIGELLVQETALERRDADERASWVWMDGSWTGREHERERLFLNSFNPGIPLPEWTLVDTSNPQPTPFTDALCTGLTLVHLHNALLKKSKRQYGEIKTFHTDLAKPYRCAENLRYWIKAAEIRWETKLSVNVSGVVNGKMEALEGFDDAILQWSRAVREELMQDWMLSKPNTPRIG